VTPRRKFAARAPRPVAAAFACVALVLVFAFANACAVAPARRAATAPIAQPALRISALASDGDARRRASTQLVLDGLASEMRGSLREALARYEDALKVDGNNPSASLAFARYEIFVGDADRGLAHLDRYEALAGARASLAHVAGLRGAALAKLGKRALARPYSEEARALAPSVWGDGRLDPRELR
jgi:tetratricopeptide (TPR) repeat protein